LNLKPKLLNDAIELTGDIYLEVLSYYRLSLCILKSENRNSPETCKPLFFFPDLFAGFKAFLLCGFFNPIFVRLKPISISVEQPMLKSLFLIT
jgi:hypothetical protein